MAAVQKTDCNTDPVAPPAIVSRLLSGVHVVPESDSAKAWVRGPLLVVPVKEPTAWQVVAAEQDTASRLALLATDGFPGEMSVQVLPDRATASGRVW